VNIQSIDRNKLRGHLRAVQDEFPLQFVGLPARGSAPHVFGDDAYDFLAEKRPGLSLLSLTGAELALSDRLDHPVGIQSCTAKTPNVYWPRFSGYEHRSAHS
jgi:hypothetical protein